METANLEIPNLREQIAPYENEFIKTIKELRELLLSNLGKYGVTFLPPESILVKKIWRDEQVYYSFEIVPEWKNIARKINILVSMEGKLYFELLQDGNQFVRATINWRKVHASELSKHQTLLTNFEEQIDVQTMFEIIENIANFFKQ